jgi:hypothetical protein
LVRSFDRAGGRAARRGVMDSRNALTLPPLSVVSTGR